MDHSVIITQGYTKPIVFHHKMEISVGFTLILVVMIVVFVMIMRSSRD